MFITLHQLTASLLLAALLVGAIVRLVQKGRLDIAYAWVWLGIGAAAMLVVIRYDLLILLSNLIGARLHTTTLFLLAHLLVLVMCLQFSLVVSRQRRQIRRLTQQLAVVQEAQAELASALRARG